MLKNVSSHIIFENNTLDSNMGIHGGAIHIDQESDFFSPNYNTFAPFIYLNNNTFTRNMAYLDGNSIYTKGA